MCNRKGKNGEERECVCVWGGEEEEEEDTNGTTDTEKKGKKKKGDAN